MTRRHYLKIETQYYQAIETGLKTFELRKNDRDFQIGDILYLQEVVKDTYYTGRTFSVTITYILPGENFGLEEGYCILCW